MADIFISYAEDDRNLTATIRDRLEQNGYSTWTYERNCLPGLSYLDQVAEAIDTCRAVLLMISLSSSRSSQVMNELARARHRDKQLLPLLHGLTHRQFCEEMPELRAALGDLTVISLPEGGIGATLSQLLGALDRMGVSPGSEAEEHEVRDRRLGWVGKRDALDVFISYRRETDAQTARLIRTELQRRGLTVFLDVDDLRPGHFDEALLKCIEEARHFIVILSAGSLDRCLNSNDWLRKEIAWALTSNKLIIPIVMPGVAFPPEDELPPELELIRIHHAVQYSHDFFEAMMEKVVSYLVNADTP